MAFTAQQRKQLRKAIIRVFDKTSLKIFLHDEFDLRLANISGDGNFEDIVFDLIDDMEKQGLLRTFVIKVYKEKSFDPDLKNLYNHCC
jgi:hypothetical protein